MDSAPFAKRIILTGGRSRLAGVIRQHLSQLGSQVVSLSRSEGDSHLGLENLFVNNLVDQADTLLHMAWSTVPISSELHVGLEWREDIPLLAKHFAAKSASNQKSHEKPISRDAVSALVNYNWPGNVRELENAIERAFILSGDEIDLDSLPAKVRESSSRSYRSNDDEEFRPTLEAMERRYLMDVLGSVRDDKAKAANILGIDLSTLYRKLKRYEEI